MTGSVTLAGQAARRGRGYWLLSRLLLEVPTAGRLDELARILADADSDAGAEVLRLRAAVSRACADPDSAAVAFTRHLVLGDRMSGEPLPFEAHVREGRLPGEATGQVEALMSKEGFVDVAPEASSPDHLGAELRFMAFLCRAETDAWQRGDDRAGADSLQRQQAFMNEHLLRWAPDYCLGLELRTNDEYLGAVAALVAATIRDDSQILEDICRWLAPRELVQAAH